MSLILVNWLLLIHLFFKNFFSSLFHNQTPHPALLQPDTRCVRLSLWTCSPATACGRRPSTAEFIYRAYVTHFHCPACCCAWSGRRAQCCLTLY